jgi:catechol 2,3-dioxygenase-like lactoylglutathione lyase family enzyme
MRKSFLSILVFGFLVAMAGAPFNGHAASVHDSGYVTIGVPDLQQATTFFRNILDCEPVSPVIADESTAGTASRHPALPASRLLLCDSGTVVELLDKHDTHFPPSARHSIDQGNGPIPFSTDDVAHADLWLRREGVHVVGTPVTMKTGPHAGQTLVNFMTPWGLQLQLVGWNTSKLATAP